jgi:hypothetical protein
MGYLHNVYIYFHKESITEVEPDRIFVSGRMVFEAGQANIQ